MQFPEPFLSNIKHSFSEAGETFLASLPALIEEASQRWHLTEVQPVSNLSYNFVAFAKRRGNKVILKIGVPNRELVSEVEALKLFNGEGACQIIDCDKEKGFLLIEQLQPGKMLSELEDDNERTRIAIQVMKKIWRPVPKIGKFIQLEDWFAELKNIRPTFDGETGPYPKGLLERVESFLPELFADEHHLIHGDFHHFNLLSSERGWLAIDPKGVIGPCGYEVGPLMINPWDNSIGSAQFEVRAKRRVSLLREGLGWEREKIIQWSMAHALLSSWWDYPNGDWEYSLRCANIFSGLK